MIEDCIARSLRGVQFPSPAGGGLAIINCPFIFRTMGGKPARAVPPMAAADMQIESSGARVKLVDHGAGKE